MDVCEPRLAGIGCTTENMILVLSDQMSVEGKVIQRAECHPVADDNYMKLKRYIASSVFVGHSQELCSIL